VVIPQALRNAIPKDRIVTEPVHVAALTTTWTGEQSSGCIAVIRPHTAEECAAAVAACGAASIPMIPAGGLTGLVGGTSSEERHVAISTKALSALLDADATSSRITVGAGTTIEQAHQHAPAGLQFGVDFGARGSATVGGAIATNAGGLRVMRYGTMRRNVSGVQFITATGDLVDDLRGLEKDNTGYDLTQLMLGSEGTLALVTAAVLKLVPAVETYETALVACPSVGEAIDVLANLRATVPNLEVAELMTETGLELVAAYRRRRPPLSGPAVLLIEAGHGSESHGALGDALSSIDGIVDSAVATSEALRADLFAWREAHTEAINFHRPVLKFDISMPTSALGTAINELPHIVESSGGATAVLYGHLGDASLHLSVLPPVASITAIEENVLSFVDSIGGSPSAEHGIGRLRITQLARRRSPGELGLFRSLKNSFDPHGLWNPGVLVDSETIGSPP
jgi:FAD/FMN-containing dehydrogenase